MRFKSIAIENYKSFWNNQEIKLETGFNLFLGANNSGKTTALEVLDLNFSMNEPHRSIVNIKDYGEVNNGKSKFQAKLSTDIYELYKIINEPIYLPIPLNSNDTSTLLAKPNFDIYVEFGGDSDSSVFEWVTDISNASSKQVAGQVYSTNIVKAADNTISCSSPNNYGVSSTTGGYYEKYIQLIYRFSAQRRPAATSGHGGDARLDREATNLPYCLNHLQTNDAHGHKVLCGWINRIFPSVQWVQSTPINQGAIFQVRCLPLDPKNRRDDLAVNLERMGSGIGNVIAMLYVVLTSRQPQVIAIDEPNSFLHPRALRELLQILESEAGQHQLILTAHSADVITSIKPSLITMFEFDGAVTTIKQTDANNISSIRYGLSDLGIRITDLHGRDRVLWVEGQSEEIVMPELLKAFCPEIAAGTAVLRVEYTGTFTKKGVAPDEVSKLYTRLSGSSGLVPPMVAILLDRELRKVEECAAIEASTDKTLVFLERRMLENYLLSPQAIEATLNSLGENVTQELIQASLKKAGLSDTSDLSKIDGAKILEKVFSELSESRHEFTKTRDVPALVSWLIVNEQVFLQPLGGFLRKTFKLN